MSKIIITLTFLIGAQSAYAATLNPVQIDVITINERPVTWQDEAQRQGIKVFVHNLDFHRNLEEELSRGLPATDPQRAEEIARKRLEAVPQEVWNRLWSGSYLAKKNGITKAPAILFNNGEAVIYGITNLKAALRLWHEYQRKQGKSQ